MAKDSQDLDAFSLEFYEMWPEVMQVEATVISYNATISARGKAAADSWISSLRLFAELREPWQFSGKHREGY